nr:PREDICTED: thyrotroph embryonic factor [Lepisosteus oculatus]
MSTAGEITMGVCSDIPEVLKALMEYPFSIPAADGEVSPPLQSSGRGFVQPMPKHSQTRHPGAPSPASVATERAAMPGGGSSAGLRASIPVVLKKLMESPPPNLLERSSGGKGARPLARSLARPRGGGARDGRICSSAAGGPEPGRTIDGKKKVGSRGSPTPAPAVSTVTLLPAAELEHSCEELVTTGTPADSQEDPEAPLDPERETPSPIDPDSIEVEVNFQPDPTDLVLSSVPGGELFNPRKHRFSEEELKPQPMIKKARKVFVPEEQKDEKYWSRRRKNNVAAKRSRDARRLKENQITVRAAFLEKENAALRAEVAELRKDCSRCRSVVARYQAKYGPLLLLDADADADMEDL